jgi:hypothetical protein
MRPHYRAACDLMTDKPDGKRRLWGLIWACMLALGCVSASASIVEWTDRPPIRAQWPHLDTWPTIVALGPALAFWWFYFTYHWRGRALITECYDVFRQAAKQPMFWFLLLAALIFCFLIMETPAVRSSA